MDRMSFVEKILDDFVHVLMELILYFGKFLSQQLVFTYSLLNHRMKLRTAVLQQVSGIAVAACTEGTPYAEIMKQEPVVPRT